MILTTTMIAAAAGYIVNTITSSKGGKQASDEISMGIWNWIKGIFKRKGKEKVVEKIEQNPEKYKSALEIAIEEVADKDPEFDKKLAELLKETAKKAKIKVEDLEAHSIEIINRQKGNSEAEFKKLNAKGNIKIDNQQE